MVELASCEGCGDASSFGFEVLLEDLLHGQKFFLAFRCFDAVRDEGPDATLIMVYRFYETIEVQLAVFDHKIYLFGSFLNRGIDAVGD